MSINNVSGSGPTGFWDTPDPSPQIAQSQEVIAANTLEIPGDHMGIDSFVDNTLSQLDKAFPGMLTDPTADQIKSVLFSKGSINGTIQTIDNAVKEIQNFPTSNLSGAQAAYAKWAKVAYPMALQNSGSYVLAKALYDDGLHSADAAIHTAENNNTPVGILCSTFAPNFAKSWRAETPPQQPGGAENHVVNAVNAADKTYTDFWNATYPADNNFTNIEALRRITDLQPQ